MIKVKFLNNMSYQKGFVNIVVIIIAVIVLVGATGYFTLVKKTPEVAHTPTSHDVKYFYDTTPYPKAGEPLSGYKDRVSIRGKLIAYEAYSKPCGSVGPCEPDTTGFILEDVNDKNYQIYIKLTSDSVVENLQVGDIYVVSGTLEYYGLDYTNKAKFIFNAERVN